MTEELYCSGTFFGQRFADRTFNNEEHQVKWILCVTPTKEYPSVFGSGYYQSFQSLIHGFYLSNKNQLNFIEIINKIPTFEYKSRLNYDKTNRKLCLNGTFKSLIDENISGNFVVDYFDGGQRNILSGLWIGQALPDETLKNQFIPINPIRWCLTFFTLDQQTWQAIGSGYFNDSADIENQPLLFFTLTGQGTLNNMKMIKKYTQTDYTVEYQGQLIKQTNQENFYFQGNWSNHLAESFGSFECKQIILDPFKSYRLAISICELCQNLLYPGDLRWSAIVSHCSKCFPCNLNLNLDETHQFHLQVLSNQNVAQGQTSRDFVLNSFQLFRSFPFLIYKSAQREEYLTKTYHQISVKCQFLEKYLKSFVLNANDDYRPIILLICDTSAAYITCLLTGILLRSIVYPINGSLSIESIQHIISITNPKVFVIGENYFDKICSILTIEHKKSCLIIYEDEKQFENESIIENTDIISFSKALQIGEQSQIEINETYSLSTKTISAILSTSGSTGMPKGAIFTEELLIPNDNFTLICPFIRIDYQPYDPVLLLSLMNTIRYGSIRGLTNLTNMWKDIQFIRPTSLGLTPSLWNSIYKTYVSKLNRSLKEEEKENILKEIRQNLGGRVLVGTTGGGAISPVVLSFLQNKLKIDVVDLYGCRECGNVSKNGIIYPGVDVKLIPIEGIDEFDGVQQGEICVHSSKIINGYWGIEKHSSFIEIQGRTYYRTGDIGQLEGNKLTLIDRSGMLIKNSNGLWISPVKIENLIEQLNEVSTSFVMIDSNNCYLIGVVCPSEFGSNLNQFQMLQLIRFHLTHFHLNGHEIPQSVYIERKIIWNQSNGLFKEKKCRHQLNQHYSQLRNENFRNEMISNDSKLNSEFINILETILDRPLNGQISSENTFIEIGADSLAINALRNFYKSKGIEINLSTIYNQNLNHLQEIYFKTDFIQDESIENINWLNESQLTQFYKSLVRNEKSSRNKNVLVTGSTGFLGPLIVIELIQQTDKHIFCLIRAKDEQHAKQRLENHFEKCQRSHLVDWTRITCFAGDPSKTNLGLNDENYQKLIKEISFVYHNASSVHFHMNYKSLKQANVQSTLNSLELALKANARLIFTSSTSVLPFRSNFNSNSNGWTHFSSTEIQKKNGYEQTKIISEQLLKQISDLGGDVVIVRPCSISADTLTGYTNFNDFLNIFLQMQIQLKTIVEDANLNYYFVPVDYCAKALVTLSLHEQSQGKSFNLIGNKFNISNIYEILLRKFPNLNFLKIKQNQWKDFVLNNFPENHRLSILKEEISSMEFVQKDDQNADERSLVDMTKTFLRDNCHLEWFHVNEQDFDKSFDYMTKHGFLLF